MGKSLVEIGFMEEGIKKKIYHYIEYKFNEALHFARIAEIHYDIFREDKCNSNKLKTMVIIELIILASDIMDDMQDKDAHKEVPWSILNVSDSYNIIVGILLICLKEVATLGNKLDIEWIQKNIYQLLLQSVSGQQIDLKNELLSESDYLHMSFMKSGSLIALACLLGAGDIQEQTNRKIREYANYLGVIFQLRNDVLDIKEGFKKNDIINKKRTLPILYYLNTDEGAYKDIQDYYLANSSKHDIMMIHQDIINGEGMLYCSTVERFFVDKYEKTINQLKLTDNDKGLLLKII